MAHPPMLCSSISVEGWSGVELLLAGLILALSMRNTLLVDLALLPTLDALTPISTAFSPTDWIVSSYFCCSNFSNAVIVLFFSFRHNFFAVIIEFSMSMH